MTEEKYTIAEAMKMKEIRIHTGIRSCPMPIEHEGETHYGTHKFMKKPEWVDIEVCRLCDYFLAESQEHQKIICCYEVKK